MLESTLPEQKGTIVIVVTGARGLLGSAVSRRFGGPPGVAGWSRGDHDGYVRADVTSQEAVERALDAAGAPPEAIIHCAANPNIAACEADQDMARELNEPIICRPAPRGQARCAPAECSAG